MEIALSCPKCRSVLSGVYQQVRELRQYSFDLTKGTYVGRSDPLDFDDTALTERVLCPSCFAELPAKIVKQIQQRFEEFLEVP